MTLDNVQEKIKKLLRLAADNPNPNEAANAFAAATALATRHALDLDDIDTSEEEPPEEQHPRTVVPPRRECLEQWGQRVGWKMTVATALARAHMCRTAWSSHGLYLYGQPEDIKRVTALYLQITHQMDGIAARAVKEYKGRLLSEYRSAREALDWGEATPRTYGRNFRIGMADAINQRVRSAQAEAETVKREMLEGAASSTALVRVNNALAYVEAVTASVDVFYAERVKGRTYTQGASSAGYQDGRRAGNSVNVNGSRGSLGGKN